MAQTAPEAAFAFTVEKTYYIKSEDRVVLVGTVNEGSVKVGDSLTVRCQGGDVRMVLEGINTTHHGEVPKASKGQQVELKLRGIRKEQPSPGDKVVASPP